ncbi:PQQ-like beta-propeller repeat protein [bacterium]|nr:PQQ-like beta-propeller repeat protein [candidate division CSSED10-310 bacterium]
MQTQWIIVAGFLCGGLSAGSASIDCPDLITRQTMDRMTLRPIGMQDLSGRSTKLWSYDGSDNCRCIRSIPDANGDGIRDVVCGFDISQSGANFYCLSGASSGTGSVIWSLDTVGGASGGYFYGDECLCPASDSDGNGYSNILAGLAGGGRFAAAYDSMNGALIWQFDTYNEPNSGWVYSICELGDVTGDGIPEVIFGCGSYNDHAYCIDGASTGLLPTVIWSYALPDASFSVSSFFDVNGDGTPDALVSSGDAIGHHVFCIEGDSSGTGNLLWAYNAIDSVQSITAISDTNGNGGLDFIAGTWGSGVRCGDGLTGGPLWTNPLGSTYVMSVRPLVDVTGDGIDEVIVGTWDNAIYCLNGATGVSFWTTPTGTLNGGDVWTVHSIDDVNFDGYDDVLAGSFDTYAYCVSGLDGTILFQYLTSNRLYSMYPAGDLDGDGIPDCLAGTQDTTNVTVVHAFTGADELPTPAPTPTPTQTITPTITPTPALVPTTSTSGLIALLIGLGWFFGCISKPTGR